MVRYGVPATRPAKNLLISRNIEDPTHCLRHVLTANGVTNRGCNEALNALRYGGNSEPLEAIIRDLMANDVDEATALRICGVDPAAEVHGHMRRWREARASKRPRHDADSDAAATSGATAARNDGAHGARLRLTVGRVALLCTPPPPLAIPTCNSLQMRLYTTTPPLP